MESTHRQDTKAPLEPSPDLDRLATRVVDAAFRVHTIMGPGLLEGIYEACLAEELRRRGLPFEQQVLLPLVYDGTPLESTLRLDLLVQDSLIVEIKAVESLLPIHEAQLLTYLKLTGRELGLLINFNVARIKDGIRRRVFHP